LVSSEPPSPLGVVPPPPPPVVGVVLVLDSSVLVVGWGVDVGSFVNEAVVAAAGLIGGDVVVLASPGVPAITKKAAQHITMIRTSVFLFYCKYLKWVSLLLVPCV
jgi:hypothetical protein